jgi:hypothetical protein
MTDSLTVPVFQCEGVTCVGCGAAAERLTVTGRADDLTTSPGPYGMPRPPYVERTFQFSPCGCRWTPGRTVTATVTFGDLPEGFPEDVPPEVRTAWCESGRVPVIAVGARSSSATQAPDVTRAESDRSCCAPERNRT